MKTKVFQLCLTIILVISLAGCKSVEPDKNVSVNTPTQSSSLSETKKANGGSESTSGINETQQETTLGNNSTAGLDNNNAVIDSVSNNNNSTNSAGTSSATSSANPTSPVSTQANKTNSDSSTDSGVVAISGQSVQPISDQKVVTNPGVSDSGITPVVTTSTADSSFSFIDASGSFKNIQSYLQYLQSQGAVYVSSTSEAVAAIQNVSKKAQPGINLCFNEGSVNINSLVDALPQDVTLSGYTDINLSECNFRYNNYYFGVSFNWWTSESEESSVNALVANKLPSLNQGTVYNKIKNVHDFICNTVNYDYDTYYGYADKYSAYDALIGHTAVCQGYALAFQKFMDAMGIPSYIVKGNVSTNGVSGPHAWNAVKLDGSWYLVDTTWDGQDDTLRYNYFLLGASENPYGSISGLTLAPSRYK